MHNHPHMKCILYNNVPLVTVLVEVHYMYTRFCMYPTELIFWSTLSLAALTIIPLALLPAVHYAGSCTHVIYPWKAFDNKAEHQWQPCMQNPIFYIPQYILFVHGKICKIFRFFFMIYSEFSCVC